MSFDNVWCKTLTQIWQVISIEAEELCRVCDKLFSVAICYTDLTFSAMQDLQHFANFPYGVPWNCAQYASTVKHALDTMLLCNFDK